MRLFHGSKDGIEGAIAPVGRSCCDFGRGFYLGDAPSQPLTLICHSPRTPRFYVCDFDLAGLEAFSFVSRYEWALYIAYCRGKCDPFRGTALYDRIAHLGDGKDVMIGKIANDRMFLVLTDFFEGSITDKAMLASLEVLNLGTQYCLKTQRACDRVRIVDVREVTTAECQALQVKSENQRLRALELTAGVYRQYRRDGYFFDEFFERFSDGNLPCS